MKRKLPENINHNPTVLNKNLIVFWIGLLIIVFNENVVAQCSITTSGTVNASTLTCGTSPLSACNGTLTVGNGSSITSIYMDAELNLTCLGAIQVIVKNNGSFDFSPGNNRLLLAEGSSITFEPGSGLIGGSCNASERIYIGTNLLASCNGGAGADLSFADLLAYAGTGSLASNSPVCVGNQITLTATPPPTSSGTFTYSFSGPGLAATSFSSIPTYSFTATSGSSGTYQVKIKNSNITNPMIAEISVIVNTLPSTPTITAGGSTTFCSGSSVTLTSSAATGYLWSTGATTQSISVTTSGSYTVKVTNTNGCQSTSSLATNVTVNTVPTITSTTPSSVCGTGTVTLGATTSVGTINWYTSSSGGSSIGTGSSFVTPVISNTTTYYVDATNLGCTTATRTAVVATVNTLPNNVINGFSATTICQGGNPQLTYNAEDSSFSIPYMITYRNDNTLLQYTISIPTSSAYSFAPADNPTSNTGYTLVSVSNATCTTTTSSIVDSGANLIVRPIPTSTINGTTSVCIGDSLPNITFANPQTVAITVTYTINGGSNQTVNIASNSSTNIAVSTTAAGTFVYNLVSVIYQSTPNCSNIISGSATVTVNPNLPASVSISASPSGAICSGTSVTFTAIPTNGGTTPAYQWKLNGSNVGSNLATYSNTGLANGDIVTCVLTSNATPCLTGSPATSNTVTMIVNPLPTTPIVGTVIQPTCILSTGSVDLSGLPASGIWIINPGGYTGTGTTTTISGLAVGTYNFSVFNGTCTSMVTANIVINPVITNTWTTSWSNGTPTILQAIVFDGNFSSTDDLDACSCQVNTGRNVVINSTHTLKVSNQVAVLGTGTLTFENNASLVQINDAAINTGNINYHRYTTPVRRYDFTYWSSPVAGQTLYNLSPNTLYDKYYGYNPSTGWVIYYNGAATMELGKGYLVRAPQTFSITTTTVDTNPVFIGVPNNRIVNLTLTGNQTHLLGNPYPSAIDADTFIDTNSAVLEGTLYFWTHNTLPNNTVAGDALYNYATDDYATYNRTGGVSTSFAAATGGAVPTGKIAAGQGFFATASTSGGLLVFNNSMRISGGLSGTNNSQFFKLNSTAKTSATAINKNRIWLDLTNNEGAFKQTLIGYITGATNNYDAGFDGISYDGNKFIDFYSINTSVNLAVQGRALPFITKDTVALGYKSAIEGEFKISINHTDGVLLSQDVFLEDKDLHVIHDLKKEPYTFTTSKGTFNNRFVLRYEDKINTEEEIANTHTYFSNDVILVSVKNDKIKINSSAELISKINIYDISGKLIFQKFNLNVTEYIIQNFYLAHQVLLVYVSLKNNKMILTKIIY